MIELDGRGFSIYVDLKCGSLVFNGKSFLLGKTSNSALLEMRSNNSVFISEEHYTDERILYYFVRKFIYGKNKRGHNLYMDIVIFESALDVIGKNVFTRSLGHVNDVNEFEVHQVLSGKLIELIIYKDRTYIGIFSEKDFFEIPAGAFHCTYVLQDHTVVANIYSNVYWENDYSLKPYGKIKNIFSFGKRGCKIVAETEDGRNYEITGDCSGVEEIGLFPYCDLPGSSLMVEAQLLLDTNVFQLFDYMMICEKTFLR